MKKALFLNSIIFALCITITGCSNPSTPSVTTQPSVEEPTTAETFKEDVESNFTHIDDYLEHSLAHNGRDFDYDPYMFYVNNLNKLPLPDPHVFEDNGTYYITGTSDRGQCKVIDCYVTTDFIDFELEIIYNPADYNGWEHSDPGLYAPEFYKFGDDYYLYYSAKDKSGKRYNSVVVADNPIGPYEPIVNDEVDGLNNPLFKDCGIGLDSTIFVDDDGKIYMYYSAVKGLQLCSGVELESPYKAKIETLKDLVYPGEVSTTNREKLLTWEVMRSGDIAEAPFMLKSNGKYYLTYSVNGCWNKYYNVCYAVSDSPLGDFVKPYEEGKIWTNLLMGYPGLKEGTEEIEDQWRGFASGTGHHSFFKIGDQLMIGYHAHQNRDWNSNGQFTPRYFAMDYVHFDKDGVPFINGPTWSPQPLPEALSGYKNIAQNATIRTQNVTNEEALTDNYIVDCYNLDDINKEVKLGAGRSYIELTFDKPYRIGGFAIYNSGFYDNAIYDVKYIDFGNSQAIKDLTFFEEQFVNQNTEFIFPNSAFTGELYSKVETNKIVISFDLAEGGNINEIVILGK